MNKEVKDFAERAKKEMLGWSQTIDDPHARVYARAFCSIVDECVDELEYEEREMRLDEVAYKLRKMGFEVMRMGDDKFALIKYATDSSERQKEVISLSYEEAVELAEGEK